MYIYMYLMIKIFSIKSRLNVCMNVESKVKIKGIFEILVFRTSFQTFSS